MQVVHAEPVNGAGLTTLQGAYDNDTAGAQIMLNAVPDPIAIQATVSGLAFEVRDVAGNPILSVRADTDEVEIDGALTVRDPFLNAGSPNSIVMADTYTTGAPFIGGPILSNGTVTYDNSVFIWALLQESKIYQAAASPGFAAFTLFNALGRIENLGNFDLVQALVLNNGIHHRRTTSGTSLVAQTIGLSNSPQGSTGAVGAILTKSIGDTAVRHSPTFNTLGFSTYNMATQRGLHYINPAVALFGSSAGLETATALIAVDVEALPFGGTIVKAAVRSGIVAATNSYFLLNNGGAHSEFGAGNAHFNDLAGPRFGNTFASPDWQMGWAAGGFLFEQQLLGAGTGQFQKSWPAVGRMLFNWAVDTEFTLNAQLGFSLGAQLGANGNQFGNFVAAGQTITIGGGFSTFLLTHASNDTVDAALSQHAAWTINAATPTIGTGSIVDSVGLLVGGNPNVGTNRYGVHVLSNPTGGTLNYCARFQGAAGVRIDGILEHGAANLGFYGTAPIAQQLGVAVTAAGIHAALVALGLIT